MLTKVRKWGNSLGLRIPKSLAEATEVREGSTVDLSVSEGQLVIRPVSLRKEYELDALLEQVTDQNLHAEIATGEPRGEEVW